ncbi:MAG: hypothetical protein PHT19_11230 [Methylococcus sp.]|nr:hypothetical protein [Methylococcus sp.]
MNMKTINTPNLVRAVAGALVCLSGPAGAAAIFGGDGMGFDDSPVPWISTVVFDKQDAKPGAPVFIVRSGDDVTPPPQKLTKAQILVPPLSASTWCDSYANPLIPNNPDFGTCYGNASKSNWYVLDLNALQKAGLNGVWVSATARRVDSSADNPLIPALTVFQGRQDVGSNLGWFPQVFQAAPAFWASRLTPFTGGNTRSAGWATAYDSAGQDMAQVTGWVKLKPGMQNFLTVAVGGDARKHIVKQTTSPDLRYALALSVSKKKPELASPGLFAAETQAAGDVPPTEKPIAAQPRFVSNGVDITLTNNLNETIQYRKDDDGAEWTDLKSSESATNTGASTALNSSITTTSFKTSHGSGYVECLNYYIGWPSCNVTLPNYGDWSDAGYFSEGESVSITLEGWSYTLTRHNDAEGFTGSKQFELIIKDTNPAPTPTPTPSPTPVPTPVPTYTVTVTGADGGKIEHGVIASDTGGIYCGSDSSGEFTQCSETFQSGSLVFLQATPATGYSGPSWTGCTPDGDNTCWIKNISGNATITATFSAK